MPFLLILFILFVVLPVCFLVYKYFVWRRRAREFMSDPLGYFMRQQQAAAERAAGRRPGTRETTRKKKKFDSSVGEYVSFREIRVESGTGTGSSSGSTYVREEQVTDAQWEDLP